MFDLNLGIDEDTKDDEADGVCEVQETSVQHALFVTDGVIPQICQVL